MLSKILIGLVVILVVFGVVVALQPAEYRVVRSAIISAPPAVASAPGLLGGQRPSMGDHVTGTGATRGAAAAGGR